MKKQQPRWLNRSQVTLLTWPGVAELLVKLMVLTVEKLAVLDNDVEG